MSALRIDTLRLIWLEAFVAVEAKENISEVARDLNVHQSTVSRYIDDLETWLGKKLIEPGKVRDSDDARALINVTQDGRQFRELALGIIKVLQEFRTEDAQRLEASSKISNIIAAMELDLTRKPKILIAHKIRHNIETQRNNFENMKNDCPLDFLVQHHLATKEFFTEYEFEKMQELQNRNKKSSKGHTSA
jgi:DNA-binding transcriptional LysR family regulator